MRAQMLGAFAVGFAAGMLTLGVLIWHSGTWKTQASGALPAPGEPARVSSAPPADRNAGRKSVPSGLSRPEGLTPPKLAMPIAGLDPRKLSDTFNEDRPGHTHQALDIPAPRGTPVTAVADGVVAKLFTSKQGGLTVYQFDRTQQFCYYYAHLEGYVPGLKESMHLRAGDVLGYVGTTGNAPPNAPHLHLAVFRLGPDKKWWQGTPIDPLPLLP